MKDSIAVARKPCNGVFATVVNLSALAEDSMSRIGESRLAVNTKPI